MASAWPRLSYGDWGRPPAPLRAHRLLLGRRGVALAPPEPQLQHAALRLTARGWETAPLPTPDRSGSLVVALDLRNHEVVIEHSGGRDHRIPLTANRSVGEVTRDLLGAVEQIAGRVEINP